mmetsp:Transcript_24416/g.44804  ORF Transcript_24416/g.44804 Transcript_24416/m.44804 type:complete len:183 (-) Transcript_24416:106-654(-)
MAHTSSSSSQNTMSSGSFSSMRTNCSLDHMADWNLLPEVVKEGSGPGVMPPTPSCSLLGERARESRVDGDASSFHTCELNGGVTYVGGWSQGRPEGFGQMQWPDGRRFVGMFRDGLRAQGRMVFADGHEYNGSWLENLPHGFGTASYLTESWGGEWDKGRPLMPNSSRFGDSDSLELRKVFL